MSLDINTRWCKNWNGMSCNTNYYVAMDYSWPRQHMVGVVCQSNYMMKFNLRNVFYVQLVTIKKPTHTQVQWIFFFFCLFFNIRPFDFETCLRKATTINNPVVLFYLNKNRYKIEILQFNVTSCVRAALWNQPKGMCLKCDVMTSCITALNAKTV